MSSINTRAPRTAPGVHLQYAALPYRARPSGELEILLITSRETKRWVIPKGWPMNGRSAAEAAQAEALEEAGVKGFVSQNPLGTYQYVKRTRLRALLCEVTVFAMRVDAEQEAWLEDGERKRMWISPSDAAELVHEQDLAELIRSFDTQHAHVTMA